MTYSSTIYERLGSVKERLFYLFFHAQLLNTRLLLSISEMTWAVALFWEGETFARKTYEAMSHVMPETQWAFAFLFCSIIQMYILLTAQFHRFWVVVYAAINAAMWWYVTIAMYSSVYPPPAGISSELALSIGASLVFLRSGYNRVMKYNTHGGT